MIVAETLSQVEAAEACYWLASMLKEILFDDQETSFLYHIDCLTDSHQ